MFGTHFYHQRIKKAISIFGSLFNNIYVIDTNSNNNVVSQVKVPLSYAPKRDFLDRGDKMFEFDNEKSISVMLPRMSFEITAMNYDTTRKLPTTNYCRFPVTNNIEQARKLYTPVPYTISFDLSIYAKTHEDASQIVEQILPFFNPEYNVTINPIENLNTLVEDMSIVVTGNVAISDDFEALLESRRTIIYTISFDMKTYMYKGVTDPSALILEYSIDVFNTNLDSPELFVTIEDTANSAYPTEATIYEDQVFEENNFKIRNVPKTVYDFTIVDSPQHGVADVTFETLSTLSNGAVVANGSWTYTPSPDFYGQDTFTIGMLWTGTQFTFPITMTVLNVKDAYDDTITVDFNTPTDFFVATNDTFSSPVTYSIASGGEASHGTVTLLNASTGEFRYTPDAGYAGSDSFIYRATPSVGISETATVSITVLTIPILLSNDSVTTQYVNPINILTSSNDIINEVVTYSIETNPSYGTVNILNASTGLIEYTPDMVHWQAQAPGTDSFVYRVTVNDNPLITDTATVNINITAIIAPANALNPVLTWQEGGSQQPIVPALNPVLTWQEGGSQQPIVSGLNPVLAWQEGGSQQPIVTAI